MFDVGIAHDDELPALGVAARRRLHRQLQHGEDGLVVDRVGQEPADGALGGHRLDQRHLEAVGDLGERGHGGASPWALAKVRRGYRRARRGERFPCGPRRNEKTGRTLDGASFILIGAEKRLRRPIGRQHSGRLAQMVRAPPSHGGGRGFESLIAHHPVSLLAPRRSGDGGPAPITETCGNACRRGSHESSGADPGLRPGDRGHRGADGSAGALLARTRRSPCHRRAARHRIPRRRERPAGRPVRRGRVLHAERIPDHDRPARGVRTTRSVRPATLLLPSCAPSLPGDALHAPRSGRARRADRRSVRVAPHDHRRTARDDLHVELGRRGRGRALARDPSLVALCRRAVLSDLAVGDAGRSEKGPTDGARRRVHDRRGGGGVDPGPLSVGWHGPRVPRNRRASARAARGRNRGAAHLHPASGAVGPTSTDSRGGRRGGRRGRRSTRVDTERVLQLRRLRRLRDRSRRAGRASRRRTGPGLHAGARIETRGDDGPSLVRDVPLAPSVALDDQLLPTVDEPRARSSRSCCR